MPENAENMRLIFDSISEYAIITCDQNGVITGWNSGAQKVFGYKMNEVIGKHFSILYLEENRRDQSLERELEKVMMEGFANDEKWQIRNDGSRFFASGVTTRLGTGESGFVKVLTDMTAAKLAQQQKDEFIGIASHELKTPVTSIKVYGELLHEMFTNDNNSAATNIVDKLNQQVERLTHLINDLLDTTRIVEERLLIKRAEFDLNDLVREQVGDIQLVSGGRPIQLRLKDELKVYADRERIAQVLTNLLSNAIKYSPKDGRIFVSSSSTVNSVIISVKDEGIGIGKEARLHVFERFYRINSPSLEAYSGMGLGLYISAGIINAHNGKIWVDSEEGKGSTFHFSLPL